MKCNRWLLTKIGGHHRWTVQDVLRRRLRDVKNKFWSRYNDLIIHQNELISRQNELAPCVCVCCNVLWAFMHFTFHNPTTQATYMRMSSHMVWQFCPIKHAKSKVSLEHRGRPVTHSVTGPSNLSMKRSAVVMKSSTDHKLMRIKIMFLLQVTRWLRMSFATIVNRSQITLEIFISCKPLPSQTGNSRRSRPGRGSVANRSQSTTGQLQVGRNCIMAVRPWLWFWGLRLCQ